MGWLLRLAVEQNDVVDDDSIGVDERRQVLVEMISSRLWDLGTTGIAELDGELVAGFESEADALAAADTLGEALSGEAQPGEAQPGEAQPGGSISGMVVEPVRRAAWIDETSRSEVTVGGSTIELEVGPAFGHGGHPTTCLALELLSETLAASAVGSVLDFGTGTGVLAIAALELGAAHVVAVENDPAALDVARRNLERCSTDGRWSLVDSLDAEGPFDLIVANVLLPVHQVVGSELPSLLRPGGSIIVSGVLASQHDSVVSAYGGSASGGLMVRTSRHIDDWLGLELVAATDVGGQR